jgi:hypothetical protein
MQRLPAYAPSALRPIGKFPPTHVRPALTDASHPLRSE